MKNEKQQPKKLSKAAIAAAVVTMILAVSAAIVTVVMVVWDSSEKKELAYTYVSETETSALAVSDAEAPATVAPAAETAAETVAETVAETAAEVVVKTTVLVLDKDGNPVKDVSVSFNTTTETIVLLTDEEGKATVEDYAIAMPSTGKMYDFFYEEVDGETIYTYKEL